MYIGVVQSQSGTFNIVISGVSLQANWELINGDNKQVRRERATLAYTSLWIEHQARFTIYQGREINSGNALVN